MRHDITGLYAITPDTDDTTRLLEKVRAAFMGGARLLQYRNKTASADLRLAQGRALRALCREFRVPLIVNDHLELAIALDADGLHVGSEDGSASDARRRMGTGKILGISCYGRLDSALDAVRDGATYVAFGGFYPSQVMRSGAARTPISLLAEAKRALKVPVVAIGGITPDNAPPLLAAGADSVAVISALFAEPDVRGAAQRFARLFENPA